MIGITDSVLCRGGRGSKLEKTAIRNVRMAPNGEMFGYCFRIGRRMTAAPTGPSQSDNYHEGCNILF